MVPQHSEYFHTSPLGLLISCLGHKHYLFFPNRRDLKGTQLSSPLFLRAVDWQAPVEKNQLEHGAGFLEDLHILGPLLEDLYHHSNLEKLNNHLGKGTKSLEI